MPTRWGDGVVRQYRPGCRDADLSTAVEAAGMIDGDRWRCPTCSARALT